MDQRCIPSPLIYDFPMSFLYPLCSGYIYQQQIRLPKTSFSCATHLSLASKRSHNWLVNTAFLYFPSPQWTHGNKCTKAGINSILLTHALNIPSAHNIEHVYSKLQKNAVQMFDNWSPTWFKFTAHMWKAKHGWACCGFSTMSLRQTQKANNSEVSRSPWKLPDTQDSFLSKFI